MKEMEAIKQTEVIEEGIVFGAIDKQSVTEIPVSKEMKSVAYLFGLFDYFYSFH